LLLRPRLQDFGTSAYRDTLIIQKASGYSRDAAWKPIGWVDDPEKAINLADPDVALLVRHLVEAARGLAENKCARRKKTAATVRTAAA